LTTPIRLTKPRFLACFAFEGLLIYGLLLGLTLANKTLLSSWMTDPEISQSRLLATAGCFLGLLLITQWASLGSQTELRREIVLFAVICLGSGVVALSVMWVLSMNLGDLRNLVALQGAVLVPLLIAGWRWASVRLEFLNFTRERVLILGTGETARQVCRWIATAHDREYALVGFAGETEDLLGRVLAMGVRIQTDYASLSQFAMNRADRVIVALDEKRGKLPVRELMELRLLGIDIEEATSFFERVSGKIAVETMLPSWLIFSEGFKTSALRSFLKRANDLMHALALLALASPLMLATAILIKLDSRGPILFRQSRVGLYGHEFNVLKFRSMRADAERHSGPVWAQKDDPRITRVGRIIRTLRIDELPQLFNVLRGEMSFVGPRPERGHFVRQLEEKIPYYGLRLTARPGVTGWAQVEYHYGASDEDALEKLKYDLYYIKNNNLLFDLWVVLKTIKVVVLGAGAR